MKNRPQEDQKCQPETGSEAKRRRPGLATKPGLANIQRVDLREVWPSEPYDFTPWLCDNISELGSALGLELEFREREADAGGISLDILSHDLSGDRPVVIENQLDATNHDHLGKLLAYAAAFDANVVVWLTREFRDEHRQALDWLNQRTGEDTLFFGVVVELWKIDDSRPAAHFNLVATPNDWRKRIVRPVSEKGERYRAFFQRLIDTMRGEHRFTSPPRARAQGWCAFYTGYKRFTYAAAFSSQQRVRVELYIDSGDAGENQDLFDELQQQKESIETALGYSLDWQPLDQRRACRIATYRAGTINSEEDELSEIYNWMVKRLLDFKRVFGGHLQELAGP